MNQDFFSNQAYSEEQEVSEETQSQQKIQDQKTPGPLVEEQPSGPQNLTQNEKKPLIIFNNVHKTLSGRKILNGLTLTIYEGETFVIIGRSGTGKSVTLKHMIGIMSPDEGTIDIFGERVNGYTKKEFADLRKYFGVLFQSGALLNSLTIEENVALPLVEHERHLSKKEIQRIVDEKLELVEMSHAKKNLPSEISGGMKKRAGLARAIVRSPRVVLYDEPTSGLDPIMSNSINELIISLQKKLGVTQIVVTHDMNSAYMIADRIGMHYGGRIIEIGTPEEIKNTQSPIVRQFIEGKVHGPITDGSLAS
ncbi:MAG: ABC transporter ATP-binding protein [Planctomycetota bacterium]|nr:MAG: ABC transporter ATP-binding protein [Planctomycetota bacterium]